MTMANTGVLCEDPLMGDDTLFGGISLDLEDFFSDDLMGVLLGPSGNAASEVLVAPPMPAPCMVPAAEQPSASGSGSAAAAAAVRSNSPSRTNSSGQSSQQAAAAVQLPVLRSNGPPTRKRKAPARPAGPAAARAVAPTTSAAAPKAAAAAAAVPSSSARAQELADLLGSGDTSDEDEDSDASDETDEGAVEQGGKGKAGNKRKAPEIDWRSITDPAERRRQRRLAKNRMTAARSRERKKVQWADMEAKLAGMDNDNKRLRAMLQQLAAENAALRGQLEGVVGNGGQPASAAAVTAGAAATPGRLAGHINSTESAVLVFIAILLLLCCALPGDRAMLLGSAVPTLLLTRMLASSPCATTSAPSQRPLPVSALLRLLLTLRLLLARTSAKLRASVHRMLFRRHHYIGRATPRNTWARKSSFWPPACASAPFESGPTSALAPVDRGGYGLPPLSMQSKVYGAAEVPASLLAVPSVGEGVLSSFIKDEASDQPILGAGSFLLSGLLN